MAELLTDPVPHEVAARAIEAKPLVSRRIFDALLPEVQARAFLVSGIEHLNVLSRIRELAADLPMGEDFKELKEDILAELTPWLVTADDPDERAKQAGEARRRAELLLRMHGHQSYARAQFADLEAHQDAFPFRQYLSSEDNRVRATHAALNRKILPADDPFWQNHTPPWEFGCRCDVVGITAEEAGEIAAEQAGRPPEQQDVMPPAAIADLRQGNLRTAEGGTLDVRTPRERNGEGYEWRPADDGLALDQILQRYDPATRADFEAWARTQQLPDGRTAWDAFQPS